MKISDLINRELSPEPFSEGEKIPWHEPGFSERMLAEHLTQAHDAASRRREVIDAHVSWIHERVLEGEPGQVLDLGCGPGLYLTRLATLGHTCHGVDIAPASLAYARRQAAREGLACTYDRADLRVVPLAAGQYRLAMLLFGELNTFPRHDVVRILERMHDALAPGGRLLLEPHTFDAVRRVGERAPTWSTTRKGLFSPQPHLRLEESVWNAREAIATQRWFIVDAATGDVTRHAGSMCAYTEPEYLALIEQAGFVDVAFGSALTGAPPASEGSDDLCVVTATRPTSGTVR